MSDSEYTHKLAELDRLLNDPDVPMEPHRVWTLLAEIAGRDLALSGVALAASGTADSQPR